MSTSTTGAPDTAAVASHSAATPQRAYAATETGAARPGSPSAQVEPKASASESQAAGRRAVRAALGERVPTERDLVIVFTSFDYDLEALHAGAKSEAAPASVVGCTSMGGFTRSEQVPHGCVATLLSGEGRSFGVSHLPWDADDVAGTARAAAEVAKTRAGQSHPHSVLLLLTDGLTPNQREVARGAYEVTGALTPFVGGAAGDNLQWTHTATFGEGIVLKHGVLAVWINSATPMSVAVGHGWHPAGQPMLVTRSTGTIVHELDGGPALEGYLAEVPDPSVRDLVAGGAAFLRAVLENPVGVPNGRGRYDVRQLHAYLPEGGGLNFNTGISEHSILQVMNSDADSLIEGARQAAVDALANLGTPATLALVFSCGSRVPLLGERLGDEARAIAEVLGDIPVCGFFTFGEFARVHGSTGVHNSSVAILVL